MFDELGTFRIEVALENPATPGRRREFSGVLVDTGAELTVLPAPALEALGIERLKEVRFRQADGSVFSRSIGSARIYAAGTVTTTTWCSASPEICCCWARGRSRG